MQQWALSPGCWLYWSLIGSNWVDVCEAGPVLRSTSVLAWNPPCTLTLAVSSLTCCFCNPRGIIRMDLAPSAFPAAFAPFPVCPRVGRQLSPVASGCKLWCVIRLWERASCVQLLWTASWPACCTCHVAQERSSALICYFAALSAIKVSVLVVWGLFLSLSGLSVHHHSSLNSPLIAWILLILSIVKYIKLKGTLMSWRFLD